MKGILNNYIARSRKSRAKKLRTLTALFLLSAVVASSVIWCLRFVGSALSVTPVYEAARPAFKRPTPEWLDDSLPMTPPEGSAARPAKAAQSTGTAQPAEAKSAAQSPGAAASAVRGVPVSAKATGEYNLALNKPYVTQYAYHPYMGQLTDGVFEADNAANLLDLKEGTYVGFKKEGDNKAEFRVKLAASVTEKPINKIRVHYRTGDSIGSPGTITCYGDGVSKGSATCTAGASAGAKSVEISTTGLSTQKNGDTVIKLTFSFEGGYEWFYISEVEVITTGNVPQFNVQYYGYVDELAITDTERPVHGGDETSGTAAVPTPGSGANTAAAPANRLRPMSISPNLPPMSAKAVTKQTISSIENDGSTPASGASLEMKVNGVDYSTGDIPVLTNSTLGENAGVKPEEFLKITGSGATIQLKISLSGKKKIDNLKAHFQKNRNNNWPGVFNLTLEESSDGSSWTPVASDVSGDDSPGYYFGTVTLTPNVDVNTKWLRLRFHTAGYATGLYEVEVYGDDMQPENVAVGKDYELTVKPNYHDPNHTGSGVWKQGPLTDDYRASETNVQGASTDLGWIIYLESAGRVVQATVDLGANYDITKSNIELIWGISNNTSYGAPQSVVVSYSSDNITYTNTASLGSSNHRQVFRAPGQHNILEWTKLYQHTATVSGIRYVRFTITANATKAYSRLMMDEIEVWGVLSDVQHNTYDIHVIGGSASPTSAMEGQEVTLTADPPNGQVLDKWTVDGGGVRLGNENASVTTFTMPAQEVSVEAEFTLPCINTIVDTRYYPDGRSRYGNDGEPGGVMPKNDGNRVQRYNLITVPLTGSTDNATLKTERSLVKIYRDNYYYTDAAPKVENVNILATNSDWAFVKIWKLKSGKSPESTTETDWTEITATDAAALMAKNFTNDIPIADGDVIRLVFDPVKKSNFVHEDTHFFDYDITEAGQMSFAKYKTSAQTGNIWHGLGINKPWPLMDFYDENNNQGDDDTKSFPFLAFGNANTGVCYQNLYWEDGNGVKNRFNQFNNNNQRPCVPDVSIDRSLNGATFGLVKDHLLPPTDPGFSYNSGLDFNVTVPNDWTANVDGTQKTWYQANNTHSAAPSMFRRSSSGAKRRYFNDMSISFTQNGDTYIIDSVGKIDGSGSEYLSGLGHFKFTVNYSNTTWPIYSNSFWAMDNRTTTDLGDNDPANDPLGGSGEWWHGFDKTYGAPNGSLAKYKTGTFHERDEGGTSNPYFGMNFDIEFDLSEDYVGPLNYFFYGDDDLWVYLDGILVCDIGGVHSSIGEYVNLWDTLSPYSIGRHKLSVFYTERGASGSSCYMRFNLPGVAAQPPAAQSSALLISKECLGPIDEDEDFTFEITLTDENDNAYPPAGESLPVQMFKSYEGYYNDAQNNSLTGTTITSTNKTITLKKGGLAVIDKLPTGVTYTVKELNTSGYAEVKAFADRVLKDENVPSHKPSDTAILTTGATDKTYSSTLQTQIDGAAMCSRVHFVNRGASPELPSTGGVGREVLPVVGLTAVIFSSLAPVVLRDKSNRKQRRASD